MFESLITNIRRKLTKPSPETADNCETVEKTGLKKRLHLFKLKLTKQDVKNPPIDQCDDIALSPRANGVAGCAQTEIEWPKITDNNPNLLDKFTRIVTITDYAPYHDKKKT